MGGINHQKSKIGGLLLLYPPDRDFNFLVLPHGFTTFIPSLLFTHRAAVAGKASRSINFIRCSSKVLGENIGDLGMQMRFSITRIQHLAYAVQCLIIVSNFKTTYMIVVNSNQKGQYQSTVVDTQNHRTRSCCFFCPYLSGTRSFSKVRMGTMIEQCVGVGFPKYMLASNHFICLSIYIQSISYII